MPLWFVSCQRRSEEKIESPLSILPSPLPIFSGLSNTSRARKPFFDVSDGGEGCGERLPNNYVPLSITPLLLRSSTSQASSELADVQARRSADPLASRSKLTPPSALVRSNPLPDISNTIGVSVHCPCALAVQNPSPEGDRIPQRYIPRHRLNRSY